MGPTSLISFQKSTKKLHSVVNHYFVVFEGHSVIYADQHLCTLASPPLSKDHLINLHFCSSIYVERMMSSTKIFSSSMLWALLFHLLWVLMSLHFIFSSTWPSFSSPFLILSSANNFFSSTLWVDPFFHLHSLASMMFKHLCLDIVVFNFW